MYIRQYLIIYNIIHIYILYSDDILICEGRARPRSPGGSMKYQFVYLNVVAVCLNESDSVYFNCWAGQGKPPGGSLKYLFVYLKIRIFKCSYRICNSICLLTMNCQAVLLELLCQAFFFASCCCLSCHC